MTEERAQKIRSSAATWRTLLQDVLALRPLTLDQKRYTALQHAAQVQENVAIVLSQLQEMAKGDTPAQVVFPLSGLLTDSAIASTTDINALSYRLADSLGQVADSIERLPSNLSTDMAERLESALVEDMQDRILLIRQSYEAYRQQQAQQQ